MKNQRRRRAKELRDIKRRLVQMRPQGGRWADNGRPASSVRSRQRDNAWLLAHGAYAPVWF